MIVRFTASAQADIAKILAQIELESPTTTRVLRDVLVRFSTIWQLFRKPGNG